MIENVSIKHFKSIKDISFPCTRVNVFIGDTNTGKSNILEALSLFSQGAMDNRVGNDLLRFDSIAELYFGKDLSDTPIITLDKMSSQLWSPQSNWYELIFTQRNEKGDTVTKYSFNYDGREPRVEGTLYQSLIRRYEYRQDTKFGLNHVKHLQPPFGLNLPGLLANNKGLREKVAAILRERGVRIIVNNDENTISTPISKDEGVEIRLPYRMVSETLRRYIFIYVAIATAEGNITLLFDEPEQNTFPFYTKHIAEMMALDEKNQYIITSHNEYLLRSLIEKTPANDLSVFITYTNEDRETQVKRMGEEQLREMLDMDVFFNIDRFLEA